MTMEQQQPNGFGRPINAPGVGVHVERADNGEVAIMLCGQLKIDTADNVRHIVEELLIQTATHRLVLDCSQVDFVDSQALALLLAISRRCRNDGGELWLRNPQPMVRKLLEMTKLDSLFKIYQTQPAAVDESAAGMAPHVPLRPFNPIKQND